MNTRDSLTSLGLAHEVALPLKGRYLVAGSIWAVSTNSYDILATIQQSFQSADKECSTTELSLAFYVDHDRDDSPRWSRPRFRALDHLYYGTFGSGDSMLVDQHMRRVISSFSPAIARDVSYWKYVIVPVLLGIASACVGVTPLHCGCLVKNGEGLLLCGESGAGKSTLALSLALRGLAYLSDDCTYLTRSTSAVRCWGLPVPLKLLPDAATYFPQLCGLEPQRCLNDEIAYEVDPVELFGVDRVTSCQPRWLVLLERTEEPRADFRRASASEMVSRFAAGLEMLPPCISHQREDQLVTIEGLANCECWVLRHGLTPSLVARELAELCGA